jgi:SAM-dependent methyltransferase
VEDDQFVKALYEAILGRDADAAGLRAHMSALRNGVSHADLIRDFVCSPEFRSRNGGAENPYPLDNAPPMRVNLDLNIDQERALWAHVARAWTKLGTSEPYWSVLSEPDFKASLMNERANLEAFYSTGRSGLDRLDGWMARSQISVPADGTCAEYGCGVGRCTVWLAKRYARVIAFDISEPHLRLAQARAKMENLSNIEFVHVQSEQDLDKINNVDIFYSIIVLQHNPLPIILSILRRVFERLNPNGVAYFQLPTYAEGYEFDIEEYFAQLGTPEMEMHFVPQHIVFRLAAARGMLPLEVSPDGMIGNFGSWISTTFLMTKKGDSDPWRDMSQV